MSYESPFGSVQFDDDDVPPKYQLNPPEMEAQLESLHDVGGYPDGRAHLIYQPDYAGDEKTQIGWIVSLVVPFRGEFHHVLAHEPLDAPGMPDPNAPMMA